MAQYVQIAFAGKSVSSRYVMRWNIRHETGERAYQRR